MKKILFTIGGIIIVIALVVSVLQWNTEVDTTTQKAKDDLTEMKEKKSEVDPHTSADNNDEAIRNQDTDQKNPASNEGHSTTPNEKNLSSNEDHSITPNENDAPNVQGHSNQQGPIENDNNVNETPPANNNTPKTERKSLAEIKSAYREVFTDLEIQETSKADQLLVQAKADYVSGEYSKPELIKKYGSLSAQLESQADRSFNAIYNQLQTDLSNQGYDQNEAVQFKNEYNNKKAARRSHAISQLNGF